MNAADLRTLLSDGSRQAVEEWCRQRACAVPMGSRVLCRALGKYMLFIDPEDEGMAPHLALDGFWEIWVTQAIARTVKPGMLCLDVGAAYGYYTVLLADLVEQGTVHAWEANLDTRSRYLDPSLGINGAREELGVGGVRLHSEALWSASGKNVALIPGGRNLGGARVKQIADQGWPTMALDDLGLADVGFIKIDAEGSEPKIWQGARETLRRSPAVTICMEFAPENHIDRGASLLAAVEASGFRLALLDSAGRPVPCSAQGLLETGLDVMLWLTHAGS